MSKKLRHGGLVRSNVKGASGRGAFEVQPLERRVLMCADEVAAAVASEAMGQFDSSLVADQHKAWHVTHSKAEHFPGWKKANAVKVDPNAAPLPSGIGTGTTGGTTGSGPQGFATRADGLPTLNSRPDAYANLLLDFDGGLWQDQAYRPYGTDQTDAAFNATEQANIVEMWRRVSEAFSPFNVNVTTVDPGNQFDRETATVIMAGHAGGGGYGYVGGFYNSAPNLGITFTSPTSNNKNSAYIAIHEAGHVFGMWHQSSYDANGVKLQEYFGGNNIIAPIMGSAYHPQRAIWWNGPSSPGPNVIQDDVAILSGADNAFGFAADDHGDDFGLVDPLSLGGGGVIEQVSDTDLFRFTASAGQIDLSVAVTAWSPMLDASVELFQRIGQDFVSVATAATSAISESLSYFGSAAAEYVLAVSSAGTYGALGQYTITGTLPPSLDPSLEPAADLEAVAVDSGTVQLDWADESSDEDGFIVSRSADAGATWSALAITAANATSYLDATATAGNVYHYKVTATNADADAVDSNVAQANTLAAPTLGAVSGIAPTKLTLAFSGVSGALGYLVEKRTASGDWTAAAAATGPNATTVLVQGLSVSSSYEFRLRARYADGYGVASNTVDATTTFGSVPVAPTNLTATANGPFQINLTWTDTPNETNYALDRSTDGGATFVHYRTLYTNAASYSDTNLSPSTTYHYRLRAYNEVGSGAASASVSATTQQITTPIAPTDLRVAYQAGTVVSLSWTDNSNSETGFIIEESYYDPYWDEWAWQEVARPAYGYHQFSNLQPNTSYTWRVSAYNAAGVSTPTNEVSVVTGPATPLNVAATRTDANTVTVSWSDVAGESSYVVQRSTGGIWQTLPYATVGADVTTFVDAAASEYDNFYYRIVARAAGDSSQSNPATVLTGYAPQAPVGLAASASLRGEYVKVTWTDAQGETGYRMQKSADDGATWQTIELGNPNYTTFDDWDVVVGQTYRYRVMAYNGVGGSAFSAEASGSAEPITQVPTAPQNLRTTSVTDQNVRLTWDADYERNYTYFVERFNPANGYWEEIGEADDPTNPFVIDYGRQPGTSYQYRVYGYNSAGPSAYSSVLVVTTIPTAPASITATASSATSITVNWADVAGETSYVVERSLNYSTWSEAGTVAADVTTFTDTGLTSGRYYYYRVSAANDSGRGAASTVVSVFTPALPLAPSTISATANSATQVTVAWGNVSNETGFRVERSIDAGATWATAGSVGANVLSFADTGRTAGTTYRYRVIAFNAAGNSPASSVATATTFTTATTLTGSSPSATQVNLSWTNVVGETGYRVERSADGATGWAVIATPGADVTTFANTALTAGTTYHYRVVAFNTAGNAPASNAVAIVTRPAATTVTATTASASQINLSWTNVAGESGYVVQQATSSAGPFTQIAAPLADATTLAVTGLQAGTTYYFRVLATNASGDGLASNTASATTANSIPVAPSNLRFTGTTSTSLTIAWNDNSGNETGFRVQSSVNGGSWTQVAQLGANVTSWTNTGLRNNRTYAYRVVAYNAVGTSAASNTISGRPGQVTLAPMAAPQSLSTQSTSLVDLAGLTTEEGNA